MRGLERVRLDPVGFLAAWIVFCILFGSVPALARGADPVSFTVAASRTDLAPGESATLEVRVTVTPPYHVYAHDETQGAATKASGRGAGVSFGPPVFPSPKVVDYPALGGRLRLFEGSFVIALPFTVAPNAASGETTLEALLDYQPCTDTLCGMPVGGRASGTLVSVRAAPPVSPVGTSPPPNRFRDLIDRYGLLGALVGAFFWGLISSLTPCVYPMIPITVAYFGGQAGERRSTGRSFFLASIFVLGLSATFAALGFLVTSSGRDLGSVMNDPRVVALVTAILLYFAFAMFEWYEIRPPSFLMAKVSGPAQAGPFGALVMGATLGLVAAPCVGPFAGSLLVFVATDGRPVVGVSALFAYGLGLGMLFVAVALGAGALLPRAGVWMIRLKLAFGLVMLGMTLYFLQFVLGGAALLGVAGVYGILGGTVIGAWGSVDDDAGPARQIGKTLGVSLVVAGSAALALAVAGVAGVTARTVVEGQVVARDARGGAAAADGGSVESRDATWLHDVDAALARGKAEGKPVFLDFYADWCLPCKSMATAVFPDPLVAAEFARFVRAKIDCTDENGPGAKIKIGRYRSFAMPYMVFYDARGELQPALTLEGYTDRDDFLRRLKAVK